MPWSVAHNALFRAAAHNPGIARSHNLSQQKAGQMAAEGIKRPSPQTYAKALTRMPR